MNAAAKLAASRSTPPTVGSTATAKGDSVRISVIGCGYLGAVHAASMSELGHEVVGIDVDVERVASLALGVAPFFEPGLQELLERGLASGRLRFTTDFSEAADCRIHFVAVGTPQQVDGDAADLSHLDAAIGSLIPWLSPGDVVVGKSTVPVGTARALHTRLENAAPGAIVAWNPEFLREGFAIRDTLHPDRLVYGLAHGSSPARPLLDQLYERTLAEGTPLVATDFETAELVKVAANAFLATKISFINAMAEICEAVDADVTQLADALGHDARIGRRFLNSGVGFGGGCLPKDIRAFAARASELGTGHSLNFLREVDAINLRRRARVVEIVRDGLGGPLAGRRVTVLGLAFKPDSDDVRDSPALTVAAQLTDAGAIVVAHDPHAMTNAHRKLPELRLAETVEAAVTGADAVVVLTEWSEYRLLDPDEVAAACAGRLVVDGRNCLDGERWAAAGWDYRALGRPRALSTALAR